MEEKRRATSKVGEGGSRRLVGYALVSTGDVSGHKFMDWAKHLEKEMPELDPDIDKSIARIQHGILSVRQSQAVFAAHGAEKAAAAHEAVVTKFRQAITDLQKARDKGDKSALAAATTYARAHNDLFRGKMSMLDLWSHSVHLPRQMRAPIFWRVQRQPPPPQSSVTWSAAPSLFAEFGQKNDATKTAWTQIHDRDLSREWFSAICSIPMLLPTCDFTAMTEMTPRRLVNLWTRLGDRRMNSAYRLFFNNRIVTNCWLQLAILLNFLILSAPPLTQTRTVYRGETTIPETIDGLVRVDNIWAVTDNELVARSFTAEAGGGIIYRIVLPIGFPILPVTQLGLSEYDGEAESLLPATMDVWGVNRTLAYRVVRSEITRPYHDTSITETHVHLVPVLLPAGPRVAKARSVGQRPTLVVGQPIPVNRFVGESTDGLPGKTLKDMLETDRNWHVWPRDDIDIADCKQTVRKSNAVTLLGVPHSHPALVSLHRVAQLRQNIAKIKDLLQNAANHIDQILKHITTIPTIPTIPSLSGPHIQQKTKSPAPKPKPHHKPKASRKPSPKASRKPSPSKPKTKPKSSPKTKPKTKPKSSPTSSPKTKPTSSLKTKPKSSPKTKPNSKPKPKSKSESKTQAAVVKTKPKPRAKVAHVPSKCDPRWLADKTRNPVTGRRILPNRRIYRAFQRACASVM